jgi:LysM domain
MFRETSTALVATLLFAIGVTALISNAAAKSPAACGSFYTVASGDTLFRIADEAYSDGRLYKKIFEANRDLLPDMQSVEIGDQLLIPCLDGTGPATRSAALAPAPGTETTEPAGVAARIEGVGFVEITDPIEMAEVAEPTGLAAQIGVAGFVEMTDPIEISEIVKATEPFGVVEPIETAEPAEMAEQIEIARPAEVAASFEAIEPAELMTLAASPEPAVITERMRILTGSGFAPYADKFLPAGGMITDLITRGVKNVAPERELRVSFVNDWEAHLDTLLPDDTFDVSFPWVKPDCSDTEGLNEMTRSLCDNFEFSNPFFEVPVGYYTRTGDPLVAAEDTTRLRSLRMCRPEGQFQFGPAQASLAVPNVELEIQQTATACLARLVAGEVDVVNLVKSDADIELRRFSDAGQIAEIEGLATTLTLHAVAAKSSPNGRNDLAVINQGLASLMASGEWFEVVVRHRSERLAELN